MHICASKLTINGSDNGLSPSRRQAIIWTNAVILLIGSLGTNFSKILIVMYTFSLKKMHLKMSSEKWQPSCLGLNVLTLVLVTENIFKVSGMHGGDSLHFLGCNSRVGYEMCQVLVLCTYRTSFQYKDHLSRYRDSHYKDKNLWPSQYKDVVLPV